MRFNRLEIDNFQAIGHAAVNIDNQGLVLIEGVNLDDASANSNGAGKSTLVNALQWAIYNTTDRDESGDAIVNRTVKKDTRVLVQIVDGDRSYNVIRHRKHRDHKNRVLLLDVTDPDNIIDLTAGTDKQTQEKINQIVGCSAEVFNSAIICGQEAQVDLPSLTDKALKMIVEEAAGIDKMQAAYRIARNRYGDKKARLEAAVHQQNLVQGNIDSINGEQERLEKEIARFDEDKDNKRKLLAERLKEQLTEAKAVKGKLADVDDEALKAQLLTIGEQLLEVDSEREQQRELDSKCIKIRNELSVTELALIADKALAAKEKTKLDNVLAEIGTDCPSCGQTITEAAVDSRRKALTDHVLDTIATCKAEVRDIGVLKNTLSDAQSELETYTASMTDTSKLIEQQNAIQRKLDAYGELVTQLKVYTTTAKGIKGAIDKLETEVNPFVAMSEDAATRLATAGDSLEQAKQDVDQAKAALQTAGLVVEVFGPAGIRAHILDTVTPYLNDRTARYLSVLSDNNIQAVWSTLSKTAKGELREKFAIGVTSTTGGETFKALSGGEKRKVRLATALALQDLVSSRSAKPIQLWIGDEIDDAVDISGLERLMTVLEEKAKEKGTVLIISHNEIGDWVRQHATVTKECGIATMTGALNLELTDETI